MDKQSNQQIDRNQQINKLTNTQRNKSTNEDEKIKYLFHVYS